MPDCYGYELISPDADGRQHFRVFDHDDNRVATCYVEGNAKLLVAALNESTDLAAARAARQAAEAELERVGLAVVKRNCLIQDKDAALREARDWCLTIDTDDDGNEGPINERLADVCQRALALTSSMLREQWAAEQAVIETGLALRSGQMHYASLNCVTHTSDALLRAQYRLDDLLGEHTVALDALAALRAGDAG